MQYFSPTGNTEYLARYLSEQLSCSCISYDQQPQCEHLIIMSSIHAFRMSNTMLKNIEKVKKVSILAIGCHTSSINDAAGIAYINYANKHNVEIGVYEILAMPLNFVKKFEVAYGKRIVQESLVQIKDIAKKILSNHTTKPVVSNGVKRISSIHHFESLMVKLFGLELHANNQCIQCGLCVKECPQKNIVMHKKVKIKCNCMLCMRCIYRCPTKAIRPRISKFLVFKDGYDVKEYCDYKKKTNRVG